MPFIHPEETAPTLPRSYIAKGNNDILHMVVSEVTIGDWKPCSVLPGNTIDDSYSVKGSVTIKSR